MLVGRKPEAEKKPSMIVEKGKKFEYGHDKKGNGIKVTKMDGKEIKREYTGKSQVWPGGMNVPSEDPNEPLRMGVAHLGIKKFKREHPNATHAEIQAYKRGAWEFPPAQMQIEMTAMPEVGKKK